MPEVAEIAIMSDFIKKETDGITFHKIEISDAFRHRMSFVLPSELDAGFRVSCSSRGKELVLVFSHPDSTFGVFEPYRFTMGMSGNWTISSPTDSPKHTHLRIISRSPVPLSLNFVDPRRFGRWAPGHFSRSTRGPCPLKDPEEFALHIITSYRDRAFKKPISEVLLDQRYFNGIGNYLRAEILYRAKQDPFMPGEEAIVKNSSIISLCHTVSMEAYSLGGGQLKDWKNPTAQVDPKAFHEWLRCYGKAKHRIISAGRTLWYDDSQVKFTQT